MREGVQGSGEKGKLFVQVLKLCFRLIRSNPS